MGNFVSRASSMFALRVLVCTAVLATIVFVGGPASATPGTQQWSQRYNSPQASLDDIAEDAVISPDNTRVFVTGQSYAANQEPDYVTFAYSAYTGKVQWAARYNGPANEFDQALAIAIAPDGSKVFVTGDSDASETTTGTDYATIAYDPATGARLWVARYNDFGNRFDKALDIEVSPDSTKVFVTGYSEGFTGGHLNLDWATVAYNASTGAQLWVNRFNAPSNSGDQPIALAVSPNGTQVFATGYFDFGATGSTADYGTIAYNAATGVRDWFARYNGPGNGQDVAQSVSVAPDGSRVFVTGASYGGSTTRNDYATIAYKATNGAALWVSRYNGVPAGDDTPASDAAASVAVSPDGDQVVVTGGSTDFFGTTDFATVSYDEHTGAQQWVSPYDESENPDSAIAVAFTPDGTRVVVTGESDSGTDDGLDFATVSADASTGTIQWIRRYNGTGGGDDVPHAMAVSPSGSRVIVTGYSTGPGDFALDYATVAYSLV